MMVHVWLGYLALAMMAVQVYQGLLRFLGVGVYLQHARLGQLCYGGVAVNVLLAYFGFPGLGLDSGLSSVRVILGLVCVAAVLTLTLSYAWKRAAAREVVPEPV